MKDLYCLIYIYIYIWCMRSDNIVRFSVCVCVCVCVTCKYYYCVMCIWFMRRNDLTFWNYEIVIEIEYKWQIEHVLICEIHVNMWWWIVTLEGVKLWTWDMIVNKCVVNTWCDITCILSCELHNNPTGVYLEKSFYGRGVKRKVYGSKLGTWCVKL